MAGIVNRSGYFDMNVLKNMLLRQKIFAVTMLREIKMRQSLENVNRRDWCKCYACYGVTPRKNFILELPPKNKF